ncbi:MAG: hypothetical protein Hens3KO_09640 [Henriciella sp.]
MRFQWGLVLAGTLLALSACDVIRVPGDGRAPPEPGPTIPEGAPGPPPPTIPVNNPYGEAEEPVLPPETDPLPETDPEPEPDAEPETDPEPLPETDPGTVEDETPADPEPVDPEPAAPEPEELPIKFQYYAPGSLTPGSGIGAPDDTVYAPEMIFPIKSAPAFPQSQVWRYGGGIGGGDQCDPRNFEAPWQDNFCETRSRTRNTPFCPTNKVHQGQDIRIGSAADCNTLRAAPAAERTLHEVVAVEDGIIQYIGGYYIQLKGTESGNIYNYIHMNMAALKVSLNETVSGGQSLGYASNDFGGTPTTFHLHFEIKAPIEGQGITHVPPYMSLVKSYERREGGRGELIEDETVAIASIPTIPEGFEIIE